MAHYRIALVCLDLCCMIIATVVGYLLRFGPQGNSTAVKYLAIGALLILGWSLAMHYTDSYEIRHLGAGPEEAKRVLRATAMTVGVLAIVCYATKTYVARGFVVGVIPLGAVLLLIQRYGVRRYVRARRGHGRWLQRILVVGTAAAAERLIDATRRGAGSGLRVIGACVDDVAVGGAIGADESGQPRPDGTDEPAVEVLGRVDQAAEIARAVDADVIAVASAGLTAEGVRRLGWQLEGTARSLAIAPALTEIAGPRLHVSPVVGLPLVWLDRPQLALAPRVVKRTLDLVGGLAFLVLTSPLLLLTAVAVKATSRGPVLFRQVRLGQAGEEFTMLKFRSMYRDAEARRDWTDNEADGGGVLYKVRRDPRVTPVGRVIRAFSIDELPQLVHVLTGRMSLVGPRPLAAADSGYLGPSRRRLLVRPGLTGLWQVSGRSDLSWEDAVRLDLYYVENWSLGMDLSILARTVYAVLARRGAY